MLQNQNHEALDIALHWQHDSVLFNDWIHIPDYRFDYDDGSILSVQGFSSSEQKRIGLPIRYKQASKINLENGHPLAKKHLKISINQSPHELADTSAVSRQGYDIARLLTGQGIGLQMQFSGYDSQTFDARAMSRLDENEDLEYFSIPDLQPYWPLDESCYVSTVYKNELEPGSRVLDLMAGIHSPLFETSIELSHLSCAGLNQKELDLNPICDQRASFNVNTIDQLPYESNSFDAVLLHAAIEYVTRPWLLFSEIHRISRPNGKIIVSFNHRSEKSKAIRLWRDTEDFEHVAIVTYYLRKFAQCQHINTESHRQIGSGNNDPAGSGEPTCIVTGWMP